MLQDTKTKVMYVIPGLIVGLSIAWALTSVAEDSELDTGPRAIPYNGILEYNGESLNGQADLQFTLTDVPGGQGANCTFTEEHDNVTAYSGRFSVNIGQVAGDLPDCIFNSNAMYIEIGIRDAVANEDGDDTNDSYITLAGSQRINPVPFSYWAAEGSDFRIDGSAAVGGDLSVAGTLSDPDSTEVTIDDGLHVLGDLSLAGHISNDEGNITINNVSINGDIDNPSGNTVTVNDNFFVNGNANVNNLNVRGTITDSSDDIVRVNDSVLVAGVGHVLDVHGRIQNSSSNNSGRVIISDALNVTSDIFSSGRLRSTSSTNALFRTNTLDSRLSSGNGSNDVFESLGVAPDRGVCFLTDIELDDGSNGWGRCTVNVWTLDDDDNLDPNGTSVWAVRSRAGNGESICNARCITW